MVVELCNTQIRRKRRRNGPSVDPCLGYWKEPESSSANEDSSLMANMTVREQQQNAQEDSKTSHDISSTSIHAPENPATLTVEKFLQGQSEIRSTEKTYSKRKRKQPKVVDLSSDPLRSSDTHDGDTGSSTKPRVALAARSSPLTSKADPAILLARMVASTDQTQAPEECIPEEPLNPLTLEPLCSIDLTASARKKPRTMEVKSTPHVKHMSVFPKPSFSSPIVLASCQASGKARSVIRKPMAAWLTPIRKEEEANSHDLGNLIVTPSSSKLTKKEIRAHPDTPMVCLDLQPLSQQPAVHSFNSLKAFEDNDDNQFLVPQIAGPILSFGTPMLKSFTDKLAFGPVSSSSRISHPKFPVPRPQKNTIDLTAMQTPIRGIHQSRVTKETAFSSLPTQSIQTTGVPAYDHGFPDSDDMTSVISDGLDANSKQDASASNIASSSSLGRKHSPVPLEAVEENCIVTESQRISTPQRTLQPIAHLFSSLLDNARNVAATQEKRSGKRRQPRYKDTKLHSYFTKVDGSSKTADLASASDSSEMDLDVEVIEGVASRQSHDESIHGTILVPASSDNSSQSSQDDENLDDPQPRRAIDFATNPPGSTIFRSSMVSSSPITLPAYNSPRSSQPCREEPTLPAQASTQAGDLNIVQYLRRAQSGIYLTCPS